MHELTQDLWDGTYDARVITTNPIVNRRGRLVMGRGCALEAANRFPQLAVWLGDHYLMSGTNLPAVVDGSQLRTGYDLLTFPVKHHWRDAADPALIEQSAKQLAAIADQRGYEDIIMPRPGCGNGRLRWTEIRRILAPILDDRFFVTHVPAKAR